MLNIACTGTGNAVFKGSTSAHSLSELASSDCDPNALFDSIRGLTPPTTPSKSSSLKRDQMDSSGGNLDIVKLTARTVSPVAICYIDACLEIVSFYIPK